MVTCKLHLTRWNCHLHNCTIMFDTSLASLTKFISIERISLFRCVIISRLNWSIINKLRIVRRLVHSQTITNIAANEINVTHSVTDSLFYGIQIDTLKATETAAIDFHDSQGLEHYQTRRFARNGNKSHVNTVWNLKRRHKIVSLVCYFYIYRSGRHLIRGIFLAAVHFMLPCVNTVSVRDDGIFYKFNDSIFVRFSASSCFHLSSNVFRTDIRDSVFLALSE